MAHRVIWEVCPQCGNSVRMSPHKTSRCNHCGSTVTPCSACIREDCAKCPYRKKGRHGSQRESTLLSSILDKVVIPDNDKEEAHKNREEGHP